MLFVDTGTIGALTAAHEAEEADAPAATYEGQRGKSVLFDKTYLIDLRAVKRESGNRAILLAEGALVETGDSSTCHDTDPPADLGPPD